MNSISCLGCLAVATLACGLPARATIERDVEKTFTVQAAGTLRIDTSGGGIRVVPGPDGVVRIVAHERIRAGSDAEADQILKDLDLKFGQSGGEVSARAKYEREAFGFHFGSWPPVEVDFTASVPARFSADLCTSGGAIVVGDLSGAVDARSSGGAIRLGKLGGPVRARTSGGEVSLQQAGAAASLETSGGPIEVGRVAGPADFSTSGGGIRIGGVEGSVRAHTSGGGIRAAIVGPLKGDCVLSTSGGSVRVQVDRTAAFRLDAETSGGDVQTRGLAITLEARDRPRADKLVGDVNGGGPLLKLRTSGGGISVETR